MKEMSLFPDEPPVYRDIPTDEIDKLVPGVSEYAIDPDAGMIESVRVFGVLNPILLIENKNGKTMTCAAGRRRVKAAKIAGRSTIPARVFPWGWTLSGVITLVENEHRSRNPLAEWKAIEELVQADYTIEEIVNRTKVSIVHVEKLLTLRKMASELLEGFKSAKIKPSVAMEAAKQKPKVQKRLVKRFKANGRLRMQDIDEERRAVKAEAVGALPDDLFDDRLKDWKTIVTETLETLKERIKETAPPEVLNQIDMLAVSTSVIVTAEPADE